MCNDVGNSVVKQTVLWLWQSVINLSVWRHRFDPVPVPVVFVLAIAGPGTRIYSSTLFPCATVIPPVSSMLVFHPSVIDVTKHLQFMALLEKTPLSPPTLSLFG